MIKTVETGLAFRFGSFCFIGKFQDESAFWDFFAKYACKQTEDYI